MTYPATIATATIGPNQVTFDDSGFTGKMVGAYKLAAQQAGGAYGQLGSCTSFDSYTGGVEVAVKACFISSSFGYGETSIDMETMLSILVGTFNAQASANNGAIPMLVTVSAPSYLATSTFVTVNITFSNFSPPPPPPASTPSKCGGAKTATWLGVFTGILAIGAAVVTGGGALVAEGALATGLGVTGTVLGVGSGACAVAGSVCAS